MVLGIQWLATLGDITWNFKMLSMSFRIGESCYRLQGVTTTSVRVISESNMFKMIAHGYTAYIAQVRDISTVLNSTPASSVLMEIKASVNDLALAELLEEFKFLFEKPTQLPPHRGHDHRIPLIEGAKPVNMRPYKYS